MSQIVEIFVGMPWMFASAVFYPGAIMPFGLICASGVVALVVGIIAAIRSRIRGAFWALLPAAVSELSVIAAFTLHPMSQHGAIITLIFASLQLACIALVVVKCRKSWAAAIGVGWFSFTYAGYALLLMALSDFH